MGQRGFCKNLRFPAVFCENLRFPAVFCENLRPRNAVIPRKSENQQKSAKISENCESCAFVPFSLSLLFLPDVTFSCDQISAIGFCVAGRDDPFMNGWRHHSTSYLPEDKLRSLVPDLPVVHLCMVPQLPHSMMLQRKLITYAATCALGWTPSLLQTPLKSTWTGLSAPDRRLQRFQFAGSVRKDFPQFHCGRMFIGESSRGNTIRGNKTESL